MITKNGKNWKPLSKEGGFLIMVEMEKFSKTPGRFSIKWCTAFRREVCTLLPIYKVVLLWYNKNIEKERITPKNRKEV